jgi:hypothetical protein
MPYTTSVRLAMTTMRPWMPCLLHVMLGSASSVDSPPRVVQPNGMKHERMTTGQQPGASSKGSTKAQPRYEHNEEAHANIRQHIDKRTTSRRPHTEVQMKQPRDQHADARVQDAHVARCTERQHVQHTLLHPLHDAGGRHHQRHDDEEHHR